MTKKEIALSAVEALKKEYPDAKCSLDYETPLQLLVATRLSAQCTDARVNLVTPALFARFPDAESLAGAEVSEVAEYIKSCGLYKTKSKDLVAMAALAPVTRIAAKAGADGDKSSDILEGLQVTRRPFRNTAQTVPLLGFGCMRLPTLEGGKIDIAALKKDAAERIRVLQKESKD